MAEAVIEVVLDNLSSLIQKEFDLFLGFDQDFNSLSSLLTTIKATLEDAEEKQFSNRAIKDWLLKLKDAAHVLDDILDECATQVLEYEGVKDRLSNKVQSSFLSCFQPKHIAFRYQITKKMKRIRERLDEIADERTKFHLTEIVREKRSGVLDWRQTTSIISQPQVYGREEDKDRIINFLVGDASSFEDFSVYPIIGLGGLGKTTIAQVIFNHEKVVSHFELRIWVCVSEDFSLKRMTKAIIESATGHACAELDLEPLQRKLLDLLKGKRYLLVLDDVWDDEQENWQRLKSVLSCGGKGTSILVTTRLLKVAAIMGTMPPHDLSMLSDTDCWKLLKQRAFGPNEEEREELMVIGKEIVKKCGGVPLAAMALGSLLRFKREEIEWLNVKESKLWDLQGVDHVMSALRLSYLNLPVKLRQCFALCALFPKDEIINKKFLIDLWMANGFISSNAILEAEDIGNEVWNELYWRSFFQDIEKDGIGEIENFKMHDLVHDLAQSVAEEVSGCITESSLSKRILHLSAYDEKSSEIVDSLKLHGIKSLRTFLMCRYDCSARQILKCYSLRVLDFERIKELPSSICHLKHLRYLDLSGGDFKTLPESLCKLWNLQILKLDDCNNLQRLPDGLVQMKALQHISLNCCYSLSSLPPHIRKLVSLKTLTLYVVGKKSGFLLAELGQMNLIGDLYIKHLERVKSVMNAKEANMLRKRVNILQLSWEINEESQLQENVEEILEVLQPQTQQLQFLTAEGYTGVYFPQWMSSSSLIFLSTLKLIDCKRCLHLPDLGKLPSLKKLYVSNMIHVKYLYEESSNGGVVGGFTNLEFLILIKMPNLVSLSREDRENMFPYLSKLQIFKCPVMLELPCLPSLSYLYVGGKCNQHLLRSIHKHHTLEELIFTKHKELSCFPDGMLRDLTSLKFLGIYHLSKLEQLPAEINNINVIQEINIIDCENLKSLPDEVIHRLHSLKRLSIAFCKKFKLSESFQYLTCLEELIIQSCPEIEGLHEALQHMTALQFLALGDFPNLASLPDWLGNLGLLHTLLISDCPKLVCLPLSIQRLTSLKYLGIYGCRQLGKRCKENTGEDWHKIAHIQRIKVKDGGMTFRGLGGSDFYI
ncbi:putative disease resistance protein RGA4 [Vicia villosa]|uniref:putative disease resistance protein RGA4 n=1 Tax=Vicia villosa TaxID=3911 RepID=UPI00273C118B|nr:putative disease resistance protein RGA4 [Vicia villosa]